MNGSEFVRELRKTHPDLPVMVISGLEEAESEYAGLNVRFLLKPLLPDLLLCQPARSALSRNAQIVALRRCRFSYAIPRRANIAVTYVTPM